MKLWRKGRQTGTNVKRALVCDDEHHIVRLIQVNLERLGHVVVPAHMGGEALAKLFSQRFDLAVVPFLLVSFQDEGLGMEVRPMRNRSTREPSAHPEPV